MNKTEYKRWAWNLLTEFSPDHRETGHWYITEAQVKREADYVSVYAMQFDLPLDNLAKDPELYLDHQAPWDAEKLPKSLFALLSDCVPVDLVQQFIKEPFDIAESRVMWSPTQGKYIPWNEYWNEAERIHNEERYVMIMAEDYFGEDYFAGLETASQQNESAKAV